MRNINLSCIQINPEILRGYEYDEMEPTPILRLYTIIEQQTNEEIPHQKQFWSEIQTLKASISSPNYMGIIQPIIVGPSMGNWYPLISGRKRVLALAGLAIENPHNEKYQSINAIIRETYQPSIRLIANRNSTRSAMETAWSLQAVWDELDEEGPPRLITDQYPIPQSPKRGRGRPKGSGVSWPNWDAVADRVEYSHATVSNHARMLKMTITTQNLIHNYQISEKALRYMLTLMPPPDFNDEIDEIIALATSGERVWGRTEIDREVDRRMGIQKTMSPEQIRTQLVAIDRTLENMWPKPNRAAIEGWVSQYAGTDQVAACRDIIEQMEKMSQKMSHMAKIYRDIEESS